MTHVQVFKGVNNYKALRSGEDSVCRGQVILQTFEHQSLKFLHNQTVQASAEKLKETIDYVKPIYTRFMSPLQQGCPQQGCDLPASVANNGHCSEHHKSGLAGT